MAKVLDKSRKHIIVKMSTNEYKLFNNILEFAEGVEDDDFVFETPANPEKLLKV